MRGPGRFLSCLPQSGLSAVRNCRPYYSSPQRSRSTSTAKSDPRAIADAFLSKFATGKPFVRTQLLDANQLRLFSLTLNRPYLYQSTPGASLEDEPPKAGTPLPPFYHLIYFTPAQLPGILGLDGTDTSFNPSPPFTRRMWAGGSVSWPGAPQQHYLRIGDTVTETTRVLSCEPKVIKSTGESMLVVSVLKEFRDGKDNLCVADQRNWVFREALDPAKPVPAPAKPPLLSESELNALGNGKHVQTFCRDEVTLFRVSALTFNGHRIHYDKPWAVGVEGHRNVVVHGPLNLISMLDLWRDTTESDTRVPRTEIVMPASIAYRATSPVYAGEGYRVILDKQASSDGMTPVAVFPAPEPENTGPEYVLDAHFAFATPHRLGGLSSNSSNDAGPTLPRIASLPQHHVSSANSRVATGTSTGEGMKTLASAAASHGRTPTLSKTSSIPSPLPPLTTFDIHNPYNASTQDGKQRRDLGQSPSVDLSKDTSVVDAAIVQKENRTAKLRRYGDEFIQLGLKDFHKVLSQELLALEADLRAVKKQKSATLIENLQMEFPSLADVARKEVEKLGYA